MTDSVATTTDPQLLLDQLAVGRDRLRAERAAAKSKIEEADRLNREAVATRKRVPQSRFPSGRIRRRGRTGPGGPR